MRFGQSIVFVPRRILMTGQDPQRARDFSKRRSSYRSRIRSSTLSPISRFVRHVLAPAAALCLVGTTALAQEAAESAKLETVTVSGQRQQYVGTIPVKDLPQNIQTLQ